MSHKKVGSQDRVFTALCSHLILQIFFEVNRHQVMSIGFDQGKDSSAKKDVEECMREIWRIFKSIVQSPTTENEEGDEQRQIFDDLHVIMCMNKLLSCEHRIPSEESDQGFKSHLPVLSYSKLHKILRNLLMFASSITESIQIEVYVQNSDTFTEVINNCLKYIAEQYKQT